MSVTASADLLTLGDNLRHSTGTITHEEVAIVYGSISVRRTALANFTGL